MAIYLNNYPHTVEGAKLELTQEQEEFCKVVYKLDDEGGAVFTEFWNPDEKYSDEYAVVPLRSVYDDIEVFSANTCFANIIGSTGDPHPRGYLSWVRLWADAANDGVRPVNCCTDNAFYSDSSEELYYFGRVTNPECGGILVGGHVIMGATEAERVARGSNIYLLPICSKHNIAYVDGCRWGAGFFMKLANDTVAVRLKNYLQRVTDFI